MKKLYILLSAILILSSSCFAQFTLNVTVPATSTVCFAYGNFNSWNASSTQMTYVSTTGSTKLFTINLPLAFVNSGTFKLMGGPYSWMEQNDATFTAVTSGTAQNITVTSFKGTAYPITINVTVPVSLADCYIYGNVSGWTLPTNAVKMALTTTNSTTKVFSYLYYDSNASHNISVLFLSALDGANKTYIQSNPDQWHGFTYTGTSSFCDFTITTFSPGILTSSPTLTGFTYNYGSGASTDQSFTVNAANLTSNLIFTSPPDFEISTGTGVSFVATNPITLNKDVSGNIASTTIYVRLKAGLNANSYNSENIACSSTGATLKNVACSGNVSQKPLTITGLSGVNKVIDGTTTASLSGNAALSGVLSLDQSNVTLSGSYVANYSQSTVGNHLGLTITGYSISGSANGNYSLNQPAGLTANIYPVISVFSGTGTTTLSSGSNMTYTPLPTTDLVVESGELVIDQSATVHSVVVNPGAKLTLTSGNTLSVADLILKASKTIAPSMFVTNAMGVSSTLKLQKTLDNTKWYFMSFPSDVAVDNITQVSGSGKLGTIGTKWWIKCYDGASRAVNLGTQSNWKQITPGETLAANQGYIIGLDNSLTGDYVLSFPLNKNLITIAESSKTIPVNAYGEGMVAANHVGWNLVGIPYLSKFAGSAVGAYYLTFYNGTTYIQSVNNEVPSINPFDAFFIQASTLGTTANLSFAIAGRQLIRNLVDMDLSERVQLNVTTATGNDCTNLILDDNQNPAYEINQDLEKWLTVGTDIPQIYSQLEGINYAYNALPMNSVVNLPIGIYSKTAGESTFHVNTSQALGISKLLLTDYSKGTITDLMSSEYTFNADSGTDNSRFVITAQRVLTKNNLINIQDGEPHISVINGKLILNNITEKGTLHVYDVIGRNIITKKMNNISLEIPLEVAGIYTIHIEMETKNWTRKIVNQK